MTKKKKSKRKDVADTTAAAPTINGSSSTNTALISPESIKGSDDAGNFYNCHSDLAKAQEEHRDEFYRANDLYWSSGGYGGLTDDEAMIGDGDGIQDGAEGLAFLDRYLVAHKSRLGHAVDLGAGVGRVTKHVLLKRYASVRLVEGDQGWSKRSRVYLGRKRAARCTFCQQKLDNLTPQNVQNWEPQADLMWVQWTLQYLIDSDVVELLQNLTGGLTPEGVIIVKENRPFGTAREDRFQLDTPTGGDNGRYDITRPDAHHRLLFQQAGLSVAFVEQGVETNTYVLAAR